MSLFRIRVDQVFSLTRNSGHILSVDIDSGCDKWVYSTTIIQINLIGLLVLIYGVYSCVVNIDVGRR